MQLAEWFDFVEANKDRFTNLIAGYHPAYNGWAQVGADFPITAPNAEEACRIVRAEIAAKSKTQQDPITLFWAGLTMRDMDGACVITSVLNQTWFGIPESRELVYRLDGFDELCDACSELEPPPEYYENGTA